MAGGGSGGGSSNTVTQTQQIPLYEQQQSQANQALASSLGAQPFPQYPGPLIQGFNPLQTSGQELAVQSAGSYQPYLAAASNDLGAAANLGYGVNNAANLAQSGIQGALGQAGGVFGQVGAANQQTAAGLQNQGFQGDVSAAGNTALGAQSGALGAAQNLTNPNMVGAYMNPYVQQALAPQIQDLQLQLAQQQQGINASATQANAFGDARQGAMSALQNLYGNQALNQLIGTGYNNAYTQAQQALGQAQGTQLGAAAGYGNIANLFGNLAGLQNQQQGIQLQGAQNYLAGGNALMGEQGIGLQGANANLGVGNLLAGQQGLDIGMAGQQAALGNQAQQQGLTGANAVYNAGNQMQTLGQEQLNAAYQQYLNQINWPFQMLNVQEGALSNSPYNIATATTLPSANQTAQGFGTLASAAGLLGGLAGNQNGNAPFGGQALQ